MRLLQIVINNIKLPIKHNNDMVITAAREIVRSNCISAKNYKIYKQSIDAIIPLVSGLKILGEYREEKRKKEITE